MTRLTTLRRLELDSGPSRLEKEFVLSSQKIPIFIGMTDGRKQPVVLKLIQDFRLWEKTLPPSG